MVESEFSKNNAHKYAAIIERDAINPLMKEFPISEENARGWMVVSNRIKEFFYHIEEKCNELLTEKEAINS